MDGKTRQLIRERLERIRARHSGVLTPEDVVKDARSESSPLHSQFEWDDAAAAHRHRIDQARILIRTVRLVITTSTQRVAAPFYIRDLRAGAKSQGYGAIAEIRDDASAAADSLRYEFDRAIGALERAMSIAEELGMADQVDDLLRRAREVHKAIPASVTKKEKRKSVRVPQRVVARRT